MHEIDLQNTKKKKKKKKKTHTHTHKICQHYKDPNRMNHTIFLDLVVLTACVRVGMAKPTKQWVLNSAQPDWCEYYLTHQCIRVLGMGILVYLIF